MNNLIIAALAVFVFQITLAQNEKREWDDQIDFRIKSGFNISTLTSAEGASPLVGFHIGVLVTVEATNRISLQPEFLFSTQGAQLENGNFKTAYFVMPIMLKYLFYPSFSVEVGPQGGFLGSARSQNTVVTEEFHPVDFGINVGAGYAMTKKVDFGLRYCIGLSNMEKDRLLGATASKNSVFQLFMSYAL